MDEHASICKKEAEIGGRNFSFSLCEADNIIYFILRVSKNYY